MEQMAFLELEVSLIEVENQNELRISLVFGQEVTFSQPLHFTCYRNSFSFNEDGWHEWVVVLILMYRTFFARLSHS